MVPLTGIGPVTYPFIPLQLSPPPYSVRGLDYALTNKVCLNTSYRPEPSSLYTFP